MLLKLAQQLDSMDEASLLNLWSKYATLTSRFEPTRRWEENALVFSMIQAKRWKNQLFNYLLAQTTNPGSLQPDTSAADLNFGFSLEPPDFGKKEKEAPQCRVLSFHSGTQTADGTPPDNPED